MARSEPKTEWTHLDFERMSWHDNHVHGFSLTQGEYGAGTFVLDLDYILEWIKLASGDVGFRIAPATLTFHDVTNLIVHLDYATPTAALEPFSLDSIERIEEERARYTAVIWRLKVNWPDGYISFEASGFEQRLKGGPVVSQKQSLTLDERSDA